MLDLAYGPDVPRAMADVLEHHARAAGLPLADIELAGRDLATAEAFILAAERGEAVAFARELATARASTLLSASA